jgi:hypothetical protein
MIEYAGNISSTTNHSGSEATDTPKVMSFKILVQIGDIWCE